MADGNPAIADPVHNPSDSTSSTGATDEQGGQVDVGALQKTVAELQEKYAASSREAHKLVDQVNSEREARLRLEGSLKSRETAQREQMPSVDDYIKKFEALGLTTDHARYEHEKDSILYNNQKILNQQIIAQQNLLKFQAQEAERAFQELDPTAKAAIERFQGIPELEGLSVGEKIQRMKELQTRFGVKSEGRDTTQAKLAAGGGSGGGGRAADATNNTELDTAAKKAGFDNHKQMKEMTDCKTGQDFADWKKRWKK